ncbi:MAG: hypothetical protein V2A79_11470 [Planctomycetota bacterium]
MLQEEQAMQAIRKRIVTNENMQPVAVQIEYADWLRIERLLDLRGDGKALTDLSRHVGRLDWPIDGLEYQRRVRSEWA